MRIGDVVEVLHLTCHQSQPQPLETLPLRPLVRYFLKGGMNRFWDLGALDGWLRMEMGILEGWVLLYSALKALSLYELAVFLFLVFWLLDFYALTIFGIGFSILRCKFGAARLVLLLQSWTLIIETEFVRIGGRWICVLAKDKECRSLSRLVDLGFGWWGRAWGCFTLSIPSFDPAPTLSHLQTLWLII